MDPAPHFVQVGSDPALICDGAEDLACGCGQPILIKGFRPERLIAIGVQCAACGQVTSTPDLPSGAQPAGNVVLLDRNAQLMTNPGVMPAGVTFIDRAAAARIEAPFRPRRPSGDPVTLSPALLREVGEAYNDLTNGAFAAHTEALMPLYWTGVRTFPLAWSCLHLQAWLADPRAPLLGPTETTVAACHLGAFRQFLAVWGAHPMFREIAALAAGSGFGLHDLAVFAAAAAVFESGSRIGMTTDPDGTPRLRGWAVQTADQTLALETVAFPRFAWPDGKPWSAASIRTALNDAVAGARGRINARHPGILVLSVGLVPDAFDKAMLEGIERFFRALGRTNPGLAALATIAPRVVPTSRMDQFGFGWLFRPMSNPAGAGQVVVQQREPA